MISYIYTYTVHVVICPFPGIAGVIIVSRKLAESTVSNVGATKLCWSKDLTVRPACINNTAKCVSKLNVLITIWMFHECNKPIMNNDLDLLNMIWQSIYIQQIYSSINNNMLKNKHTALVLLNIPNFNFIFHLMHTHAHTSILTMQFTINILKDKCPFF